MLRALTEFAQFFYRDDKHWNEKFPTCVSSGIIAYNKRYPSRSAYTMAKLEDTLVELNSERTKLLRRDWALWLMENFQHLCI